MTEDSGLQAAGVETLNTEGKVDLNTITPDVVGGLALSMGLVVTGATEGIRRTAQRTVDHFQQLNEQFPPHTAEGHFLDRIEMAALTASSVLTKSYLEMKAVIKRAKEDYKEATLGDMGSQVKVALAKGVLKILFIMGLGYVVTSLLLGVSEQQESTGEKLKWLPLALAFALPVITNTIRDVWHRWKMTNMAYKRDTTIAGAKKKRARAQIKAIECALTLSRLAWEDFSAGKSALPKETPVLTLFKALNEEELTYTVPPPFFAMVREKAGGVFRRSKQQPLPSPEDEYDRMIQDAFEKVKQDKAPEDE